MRIPGPDYLLLTGILLLAACMQPAGEKHRRETAAYSHTLHVMDSTSKRELNALRNCRLLCQQVLSAGTHPANGQGCDRILHHVIDSLNMLEQEWPLADERLRNLEQKWASVQQTENAEENFELMLLRLDSVQVLAESRTNTLSRVMQQSSECLGLLPD